MNKQELKIKMLILFRRRESKMINRTITITLAAAQLLGLVILGGCQNGAQTGSVIGSLAGAGIGQLAGGDTEATLIGAAVGAGAGYIFGNESDKRKTQNQMYAMNNDINSQIVNVTNSNGSVIQVKLHRQGVGWVGTRGEYYAKIPSEDQLRPVYGF
jgi:hypothetical protein